MHKESDRAGRRVRQADRASERGVQVELGDVTERLVERSAGLALSGLG